MNKILISLFSLLFPALSYCQKPMPGENTVISALIELDSGISGSGFSLLTSKYEYIVTAKHVLFNDEMKPRGKKALITFYSSDTRSKNIFSFDIAVDSFLSLGNITYHPVADLTIIRIGTVVKDIIEIDKNMVTLKQVEAKVINVGLSQVETIDQVSVSNEIFLHGYPTSLRLKNMPGMEYNRPLLRKGIVAGINYDKKIIIIDCFTFPGNSGGPVMAVDVSPEGVRFFSVIGIVSAYIPYALERYSEPSNLSNLTWGNSGYTIVTPIDFALELVNKYECNK